VVIAGPLELTVVVVVVVPCRVAVQRLESALILEEEIKEGRKQHSTSLVSGPLNACSID